MTDNLKCYICNSPEISRLKEVDRFAVFQCAKCGLKWVTAGEIASTDYSEDYFNNNSKIGYSDYLKGEKNHRRNARSILNNVAKIRDLSNSKVLDVGCAFGFLLDEARKTAKCEVTGAELSSYASEYARNNLSLNVVNLEISKTTFQPEYFDIVFMIGTIEHLVSPDETLDIVGTVLKPGGLLVLTTIDTCGLFPLYSIKPPEHLFYFNHKNLPLLLNKFAFKVRTLKTYFASYYLYDIVYRMGEFVTFKPLIRFSKYIERFFPDLKLNIPTNEMLIIARKQ